MKVVDANVLIYAVNSDAAKHEPSRIWLDRALSGADAVGLTWVVLLAFLRIVTRHDVFPTPLTVAEALEQIADWTAAPGAQFVEPGPAHLNRVAELLTQGGAGGNLVTDAHLAAIALDRRANVVSYDRDFGRFRGLPWSTPDELLA